MKNELQRHKTHDAIKWVAIFLIVILLAVAVFALCVQVFNLQCKIAHDFDENGICVRCGAEKPIDEDKPADDDTEQAADGGGMAMGENFIGNGIMLLSTDIPRELYSQYDIAPIAETAKQLTATITPAETDRKEVNWLIAWKNASSSWANGKTVTDYVTVTPTADGALTANVSCLQAFAEQIIITVQVRSDHDITATCTVDYVKKLQSVAYQLNGGTALNWTSGSYQWTWLGSTNVETDIKTWSNYQAKFVDTYSIGTLDDAVSSHSVTIALSSALQTAIRNDGSLPFDKSGIGTTYTLACTSSQNTLTQGSLFYDGTYGYEKNVFWWCASPVSAGNFKLNAGGFRKLATHMKSCSTDFVVTIKATTASGVSYSKTCNINVSDTSLAILAEGLQLSETGLKF